MNVVSFVTNFGDLAVLVPLALTVLIWLLWVHNRREALWWCVAVVVCTGGTAAFKIFFYACPPIQDLHSPSGHTAFSALVYGAIAGIIAIERSGWRRVAMVGLAPLFIAAIAVSRVLIEAHTVLEVVVGLSLGLATLGCFLLSYRRQRLGYVNVRPMLIGACIIAVLLNGKALGAEDFLHLLSRYFDVARVCNA